MLAETCATPYVDLGPYDERQPAAENAIPLYVFPSVPPTEGGAMYPSDMDSLYNPYRLQNNVFAGEGRVWAMWQVYSADLNLMAAPATGGWIWGEEAGRVKLVNLFKNVDCLIVEPGPEDIIVNLNPGFPICE